MPVATSPSAVPHPTSFVKMEDRKRPAISTVDDLAPPSKRQAVNGGGKAKDDSADMKEEAWIEEYQKGAIYRQMLEYKREKINLESRLQELEGKSTYHDDHIRLIDAWWLQLVQEIELLVDGTISSDSNSPNSAFPTGLTFSDNKDFQQHLAEKAKAINARVGSLFSRLASSRGEVKSDVAELEYQVKRLLAGQKDSTVKLDRLKQENETLSDQYNTEILKVIKAERKLDRARSAQVQKLEQQALHNATARPAGAPEENGAEAKESNGDIEALQRQYQETIAVASKQKEQLTSILAEIKGLQEENSSLKARREAFSDEDYVRSDVFKQFKSQSEDLIRRINHLEATNKQLREEAEKLQAERTAYRVQLEREAQDVTHELEDQIQAKEQDLTRVRSARDELLAENSQLKQNQSVERSSLEHLKELTSASTDRIKELESELERLRQSEDTPMSESRADVDALPLEVLRQKYLKLEKDFESINKEMPLLEKSYKKAMGLANKKVMDFSALEDKVAQLSAEKSKADQKYFAARKDMDIRNGEIRSLRMSNGKSSEIISQLKDAEAQSRTVISNLEKQLVHLKQSNSTIATENKRLEMASLDATRRADGVKTQVAELTNLVKARDKVNISIRESAVAQEAELEKFKVRVDHISKDRDNWKSKSLSNSSEEEEILRKLALCSICRSNFKNTILKTCGHTFCNVCVENRIANRMRKCPACNKAFDKLDVMAAHLQC